MPNPHFRSDFLDFIRCSPTSLHACIEIKNRLIKSHFQVLDESKPFELEPQSGYFIESDGALFAFKTPKKDLKSLRAQLSHTDSPGLKVKHQKQKKQADLEIVGVEIYGSPLLYTWVDQILFPAGTVYTSKEGSIQEHLVELRDFHLIIPPLAIHLNKEAGQKGVFFDRQFELNPLFDSKTPFLQKLEEKLGASVLSSDLFLVPLSLHEPALFNEWLASYRIDNLSSVYASLLALMESSFSDHTLQIALFFDHEEIGSRTNMGADSLYFVQTLRRITQALSKQPDYFDLIRKQSFAFSVDVAHALHPHHPTKHDQEAPPILGKGPAIKFSAGKKYASTAKLAAFVHQIKEDQPVQHFYPHGEIGSGSTVGPFFSAATGIETLDIGMPILGMHALKEIMALDDLFYLKNLLKNMYTKAL